MNGPERISELRVLARLAADRAQAGFSRLEAGARRIRGEISSLEKPLSMPLNGDGDGDGQVAQAQALAKWECWRQLRHRKLEADLAAQIVLCDQARSKAARLEAKVRAVDRMLSREIALFRQSRRNRALRQGLPDT